MYRSAALIALTCFLSLSAQAAELCGFPGRDGERQLQGVINRWLPAPDNRVLEAGTRQIPVADSGRGRGALQTGDLLLLVQMQGAELNADNTDAYGDGVSGDGSARGAVALTAGQFEFLRLEAMDNNTLTVRGAGTNGGLVHRYVSRAPRASGDQGALRWQLVRVPQFENLTLSGDLRAEPWDGRSGGVLAVDVRRTLRLNGFAIDVHGAGFRGGAALSLQGALGDERDYVYPAPAPDELAVGYGQHASKGEGLAGTPRWLHVGDKVVDTSAGKSASDGYPDGSMAKGAPANAGGGGVSLNADNRVPSGGGGGAGGEHGKPGEDSKGQPRGGQGGGAVSVTLPALVAGGGGGAATRYRGEGGHGAAGGGIVLIRAGVFIGDGTLDVRGADSAATQAASGGAGGAGTLWLQAPFGNTDKLKLLLAGGQAGQAPVSGGDGGAGRLLYSGELPLPDTEAPRNDRLQADSAAGVAPGYRCRPAGMMLGGTVFEDNGAADAVAHDGRRQWSEKGLADWPVAVRDLQGNEVVTTRTSRSGQFALELSEQWAGKTLRLEIPLQAGWHPVVALSNDLPLAPFRYLGAGRWEFVAQKEYLQDGLVFGLVREAELQVPSQRSVRPGSTQFFLFRYVSHTDARARLRYRGELSGASDWRHAFFIDPDCDNASEYVEKQVTSWLPVQADEPVCVRVRVDVPASVASGALDVHIDVESDLGNTPLQTRLPPVNARIRVTLEK